MMDTPTDWETPCPKREDKRHCNCWYDGEACCACGAPATTPDVNNAGLFWPPRVEEAES